MGEFELIREHFTGLTSARTGVKLGIGDDAALLRVPPGHELVVTTDTLVAGRHFPDDTAPEDVGWKSLAVNLSDLAAMGAQPRWFTLALTVRLADPIWVGGFAQGLREAADFFGVALVGGDTTQGPLSITITAMGAVPIGRAIRRSGAKAGDLVCVTGTLGDAALALRRRGKKDLPDVLQLRLNRPAPRVAAALALRPFAHAMIDLSDGLAGDLQHVLDASRVGATIRADLLPASPDFAALAGADERLPLQAGGGDDYELCVCIPPAQLKKALRKLAVPLTVIGEVTRQKGLRFVGVDGRALSPDLQGYRHFE